MKTITICHSKGGVGKSTLAWNTAVALIGMGHRVAMIDLDVQHTITHTNTARVHSGYTGIEIFEVTEKYALEDFLIASQYDFVLIDVGGYDFDLGRAAIALADQLIVPISDNPTELFGFITFSQFLSEIEQSAPVPPMLAVINAIHPRASNFASIEQTVSLYPPASIASTVIRRRMVYSASMGNGFGVTELGDKFPQAAHEIESLVREVIHGTL